MIITKEKENSILSFVKENILKLTSRVDNTNDLRALKKEYFLTKLHNKVGHPSDQEIAKLTVKYLASKNRFKSFEELVSFVEQVPFLKQNVLDLDSFEKDFGSPDLEGSLLTIEDLKHIGQTEFLQQKVIELKNKVIQENTLEIDKAIERKKKEYESLPSILDKEEIKEPQSNDTEDAQREEEWWQLLDLSSDPFPRQEGLDKIPENIFEKVVYRNALIQDYITRIESNKEKILNKGILLLGYFGTGKTTIFDYLSYYFVKNKICPVRLTFTQKPDVFAYLAEFETKLYDRIKKVYENQNGLLLNGPPNNENSKRLMLALKENGWSFMIIIDDLHKHEGYEETVLKFLSALQIIKDDFIRSRIDIGFMVAGIPSWELKMQKDGSLLGFFDTTPERIPEVSPDDAHSVINNRLIAYSLRQGRKNVIDKEWIRKIHQYLKAEGMYINYRLLINAVIKELKNKNFDILKLNYMNIPEQKMSEILGFLEDHKVMDCFRSILHNKKIGLESNKVKALELCVRLYINKKITELEPDFIRNQYYYQILSKSKIIVKQKAAENFNWTLEPKIASAFDQIFRNFGFSPEDYFIKLFYPQRNIERIKNIDLIEGFDKIMSVFEKNNDTGLFELLTASRNSLNSYFEVEHDSIDSQKYQKNIDLLVESLATISRALFIFEGMHKLPSDRKDLLESWSKYWFLPAAINDFINYVWYNLEFPSREKAGYVFLFYKESVEELLSYFENNLDGPQLISIPYKFLKKEENTAFVQIKKDLKTNFDGKSYFEVTKTVNNLVENKLRVTLFNHFNLIFGDIYNRLNQLGSLKIYLEKIGIDYSNEFFNEFQNLNRGEYKQLILQNNKLNRQYFKHLFRNFDLENYLDTFCETNIIISHLKSQQITSSDQSYVLHFVIDSIEVIKNINQLYFNLLNQHFYFKIIKDKVLCYFSIPGLEDDPPYTAKLDDERLLKNYKDIKPIEVSLDEINMVYERIKQYAGQGKEFFLDLENFEMMFNLFSISYVKVFSIIALLNYATQKKSESKLMIDVEVQFGSQVKITLH